MNIPTFLFLGGFIVLLALSECVHGIERAFNDMEENRNKNTPFRFSACETKKEFIIYLFFRCIPFLWFLVIIVKSVIKSAKSFFNYYKDLKE